MDHQSGTLHSECFCFCFLQPGTLAKSSIGGQLINIMHVMYSSTVVNYQTCKRVAFTLTNAVLNPNR